MDVGTYIENLKGIDIKELIISELKTFEVFLADLNRKQMRQGFNSEGTSIGTYFSESYAIFKQERPGRLADKWEVDLFLEGYFSKGIFAKVEGESILFDSTDSKSVKLENKYGKTIFGLSQKSISELIPDLIYVIIQDINTKLAT